MDEYDHLIFNFPDGSSLKFVQHDEYGWYNEEHNLALRLVDVKPSDMEEGGVPITTITIDELDNAIKGVNAYYDTLTIIDESMGIIEYQTMDDCGSDHLL